MALAMKAMLRAALYMHVASALVAPPPRRAAPLVARAVTDVIADKLAAVEEPAALNLAERYEVASLPTSDTAFVRTSAAKKGAPALVLLHGFDSSLFEYRRLIPELEARGVAAYAIDVVGWGLTEPKDGVSVAAKRQQVDEFVKEVVGSQAILCGASLGAAVAVDAVAGGVEAARVALIGPQCFLDGAPPVPEWGARLGIRVLRSWPLRALANKLAYSDKSLGSADAIRVGLLHCERAGWEDDAVEWLLGGGYSVSALVEPALRGKDTLVLWGDADEILPPKDALPKFAEALPAADIRYVEACGHVPHLEQPAATAEALAAFVQAGAVGAVSGTVDARS
mmetsp:Transcript_18602/g.55317  ORF Transcript_18602/g.55317 Transcript_18602/m.55317 type:complete len:339 (+) Transcript_18602:198-1214(+)